MICHSKRDIDPAPQDAIKTTRWNNIVSLAVCAIFIYVDHLAWPLVVGALLGKRRGEPSPRHLLSFRAPTVPY
jgi:hypothetical protein